jgi:hypothetical protein
MMTSNYVEEVSLLLSVAGGTNHQLHDVSVLTKIT